MTGAQQWPAVCDGDEPDQEWPAMAIEQQIVLRCPVCLIITSGAFCGSSRYNHRASGRVLIQQGLDRFGRIVMQPIALLAWALALRQALSVRLIVHQSDLTDGRQQLRLTLRHEQDLISPQGTQRPGGCAATDPSFVFADAIEERFQ